MKSNCKNYFLFFAAVLFAFSFTSCTKKLVNSNTYYINNQEDFNKHSGTEFPEGSTVLFAQGAIFEGQFVVKGSGSAANPNIIAAYNPIDKTVLREWAESKPVINGLGKTDAPLYMYNGQYWEINNLEITNTDGSDGNQGLLKGIYVVAENAGTMNNVTIKNCFVHDVNGKVGGKFRGGIHVHVLGEKAETKFNKLLIENNVVRDVGGVGIGNQSSWGKIQTPTYYPWTNFVIRGNFVERTGRNSIIVRYAINPLVEYNVAAGSSRFDTGHSIFNFNTVGCVVQYNEAYGNTGDDVENERGGFDADYNSTGTIIQYNYSHDNNWFSGIMRRGINSDVTIRYNISQNELIGAYLYGFPTERGLTDVKIYNNVHYFGKGKGNRVFVSGGKVRVPIETTFRNNIFYFEDAAQWGFDPEKLCVFENNLYYNLSAKGSNALSANPLFVNPGKVGTNVNMRDPALFDGYRLQAGSSAINAGIEIKNNGGKDMGSTVLYNKLPDIGAFENK